MIYNIFLSELVSLSSNIKIKKIANNHVEIFGMNLLCCDILYHLFIYKNKIKKLTPHFVTPTW